MGGPATRLVVTSAEPRPTRGEPVTDNHKARTVVVRIDHDDVPEIHVIDRRELRFARVEFLKSPYDCGPDDDCPWGVRYQLAGGPERVIECLGKKARERERHHVAQSLYALISGDLRDHRVRMQAVDARSIDVTVDLDGKLVDTRTGAPA